MFRRFLTPSFSLMAVLVLSLIARAGVQAAQWEQLNHDIDAYRGIAERLVAGEGFAHPDTGQPTAYRPVLYPLLLAGALATGAGNLGIAILHLILGLATVGLTWRLGVRLNLGAGASLAALAIGLDPLLIQYATVPMTETLCTFLAVLLLNLMVPWPEFKRGQLALGVVWGLSVLSRPTFLVFGGLALLLGMGIAHRLEHKKATSIPWLVLLGALLTISPWVIRNAITFGQFRATTTHGGYTLLLGNNPVFYREVVEAPWGTNWEGESLARWQAALEIEMSQAKPPVTTEADRDRWMARRARENVAEQPGLFLKACFLRFVWFWNVAPPQTALDAVKKLWNRGCQAVGLAGWQSAADVVAGAVALGVCTFYSVLLVGMLLGLARLTRAEWSVWWPLVLMLASFCAVHLVYWSNTRMRAPVMPVVALLAVRGWGLRSARNS